jgi:hypothetical protein
MNRFLIERSIPVMEDAGNFAAAVREMLEELINPTTFMAEIEQFLPVGTGVPRHSGDREPSVLK